MRFEPLRAHDVVVLGGFGVVDAEVGLAGAVSGMGSVWGCHAFLPTGIQSPLHERRRKRPGETWHMAACPGGVPWAGLGLPLLSAGGRRHGPVPPSGSGSVCRCMGRW